MVEIRWKRGGDVVEIWWICSGKNGGKVVEKVLKFRWNSRGTSTSIPRKFPPGIHHFSTDLFCLGRIEKKSASH